ncbi:unnamed protein product [Notodromas monacha]|uniref:CCHC-type domain-containing protein n=1 Tax=Notodromas monacha TaxID=399045 RepID=A0A7R9BZ40_9CRUS|nr:unnamed protein product [Notodromas monacha]CAG0922782.1 unnamed protein product [Notodromas monacha]
MSESWNKRDVGPGSSRFFQKPPSFGSGFEFDLSFPLEKPAIKIIDETKQGHVVDSENLAKSDPSKLAVQFETEIQEIHVEEPGSTTELLQQKVPAEFVNTFSQHKQHKILNYKDFMPLPRNQHPPETLIRRERFPDLVIRANKWLMENKEYSAAFCQTISHFELPKHKKHKHKSDSTIVKIGNSFGHTHGLRIWLKKNESGFPQRLQYFDTVPRAYESFASHSKQRGVQTYESIDRVVERINDVLRITSLPGRIITAETVTTPHPDDPELCHFWERKDIQDTQYVHFLRFVGSLAHIMGVERDALYLANEVQPRLPEAMLINNRRNIELFDEQIQAWNTMVDALVPNLAARDESTLAIEMAQLTLFATHLKDEVTQQQRELDEMVGIKNKLLTKELTLDQLDRPSSDKVVFFNMKTGSQDAPKGNKQITNSIVNQLPNFSGAANENWADWWQDICVALVGCDITDDNMRTIILQKVVGKAQEFLCCVDGLTDEHYQVLVKELELAYGGNFMGEGALKLQTIYQGELESVLDFSVRIRRVGQQMLGEAPSKIKVLRVEGQEPKLCTNPFLKIELIRYDAQKQSIDQLMVSQFLQGMLPSLYDRLGAIPITMAQALKYATNIEKLKARQRANENFQVMSTIACKQQQHPGNNNANPTRTCWNCGKPGHFSSKCYSKGQPSGATANTLQGAKVQTPEHLALDPIEAKETKIRKGNNSNRDKNKDPHCTDPQDQVEEYIFSSS